MRKFLLPWLALPIAISGASSTIAKVEFDRPPYAGGYEPQGRDERGLWMEIDDLERSLRDSPNVVKNAELNSYLRSVLCKAVGPDRCASTRLYLIQNNSFNASMYPNGMMLVHTGLLARMHSEAELAAVLGHEFGHFEKRHSLEFFKKIRNAGNWAIWISVLGAAAAVQTNSIQNSIVLGTYSFSRLQETEADFVSAQIILASGYPLEASRIWSRASIEADLFRAERGLKGGRPLAPGLTDTHPTNLQRFAFFSEMESKQDANLDAGAQSYRKATDPFLSLLFDGLIKSNQFAVTEYLIRERGEKLGWSGSLRFLYAELFRLRANPRDLVTARDLFNEAIKFADAPPEVWRGLGLCEMRLGNGEAGKAALKEYLNRNPSAKDADTIKMLLEE